MSSSTISSSLYAVAVDMLFVILTNCIVTQECINALRKVGEIISIILFLFFVRLIFFQCFFCYQT